MGGSDKIHITFYKLPKPKGRKTDIWEIITLDRENLGYIKFDGAWRQFIFEPSCNTKWSFSCCDQVSEFLVEQNTKWKNSLKEFNMEKCNFKFMMPKSKIVRCQLKIDNIQLNECDGKECIFQRLLWK